MNNQEPGVGAPGGDHAMEKDSTSPRGSEALFAGEAWFDPIEAGVRDRIRGFIEAMLEEELTAALGRGRYERGEGKGHRHGRRERQLLGSFGPARVSQPPARVAEARRHPPGGARAP